MNRELIAEEQGVDLSDQTLPTKADYMSDIYECLACHHQALLDQFKDLDCDGDILGTCPKCGQHGLILEK